VADSSGRIRPALLERVVDAYGGADRWRDISVIEAELSAGGLLLAWKRGRAGRFDRLRVVADVHRQQIRYPAFHEGMDGVLRGHDVSLETSDGPVMRRQGARARFPYGQRLLHWDALDMMYFFGYAIWNYLTFPALLLRADMRWEQTGEQLLTGTFPAELATHCPRQTFRIDPETGLVDQHHYTAEVFGPGWARACHLTSEYREADGIRYASHRRVHPMSPGAKGPMSRPLLIWADIHELRAV
jgi:hypothetical protein